jgi:acetyl-CoA synthetase
MCPKVNCVDRHAKKNPNKVALIWEKDEPGQEERITYGQLQELVQRYAWILREVGGVKKGDRVAFYLPCGPTAVAMCLACARIGAVHSIVFAGFSAEALASRINDGNGSNTVDSRWNYSVS